MKYFKSQLLFLLLVTPFITNAQFVTTWKTDNPGPSNDNQITIPIFGGGYNYNVDWGDGSSDTNLNTEQTHTYAVPGTYTVTITGAFPRIRFNAGGFSPSTDYGKILTIEKWGDNAWTSMENAFSGCENLRINASDSPNLSGVTDLTYMFKKCEALNDNINGWDVSSIIQMKGIFREATAFNQPLNNWDVSNVTNMVEMFFFASSFNQYIGGWNTSSTTDMSSMFGGATMFDQDISQKLSTGAWNTSNVISMHSMFAGTEDFDQPIGNWNTSSVTNIASMFASAHSFNQDVSGWDISGVSSLSGLFKDATAFDQDLSAWSAAIGGGGITDLSEMFKGATAFDQDLSGWNVSSVTDMRGMFSNTNFNPDISVWDVSSVTNFHSMFKDNTGFNQDISNWALDNAFELRLMFDGASAFDQDLGGWDISNITGNRMIKMLDNSGLSVDNYDKLLIGWATQSVNPNVSFGALNLFYCAGAAARNILTSTPNNWNITDAGVGCIQVFEGDNITGKEVFDNQVEPVDIGSGPVIIGKARTITILNNLNTNITFNAPAITPGSNFLVTSPSFPTAISAGSTLSISVLVFDSSLPGTYSENISFTSPDFPSGYSFDFPITGVITALAEPEIKVFEGNTTTGVELLDGIGSIFVGGANRGDPSLPTTQIIIENRGSSPLTITGITLGPSSAFSFTAPAFPIIIPVDGTQTIDISLDTSNGGSFNDVITIENGDVDESSFAITLNGTIYGPELVVIDGTDIFSDPRILSGQADVIDFGSALQGSNIVRQFVLTNDGPVDLSIDTIDISGGSFSTATITPAIINGFVDGIYTEIAFNITLDGTTAGNYFETVTITSDDDAFPVLTFDIAGNIIDPNTPKVYWTDNNEINRTNLDGTGFQQYHTEPAFTPRGIAIDTLNSIVYWTNNWGQIRKGTIGGTGITGVMDFMNDGIDTSRKMGGLALDVAGDSIYWISSYDGTIKKASLSEPDPANVTTTNLVDSLSNPIGIAIDPTNSFIYYTENVIDGSGDNIASLHRVDTDGSNDFVLSTQTILGQQYTYNDVAVNPTDNSIYWTASNNDIYSPNGNIYEADLADVAGTTVSIPNASPNLPYGIDLDIENKRIYWTDLSEYMNFIPATVNAINIDGSNKIVLQSNFPNLNYPLFIALDLSVAVCQDSPTADAGQDVFICSTDMASLSGTIGGGATSSIWTTSGDGFFNNASLEDAIYTPGAGDIALGSATLTLTANAINCTPVIDQMLINISLAISVIDQSATVNVGETSTIDVFNGGFVNAGDAITTTLLSQPQKGTTTINNDGTIEYTALEGNIGTDSFDFQIENQCNSTASATIIITIPNTAPGFNDGTASAIPGAPVTINITDLITDLNGNIDLTSIQIIQQPGSGAPTTLDADNNLVVDYTGMVFFGVDEIVIRVCDFDGACTEASIFITVEALPIEAYNAVSPNGDGRHDFLEFKYIEAYPENQVKIFSRWGDIVFEIDGYNNVDKIFIGVANKGGNKELPTGTYYYTVVLKLPTDKFQTVKGYFELRR